MADFTQNALVTLAGMPEHIKPTITTDTAASMRAAFGDIARYLTHVVLFCLVYFCSNSFNPKSNGVMLFTVCRYDWLPCVCHLLNLAVGKALEDITRL